MELRAKLLHVLTVKDMTDLCADVLEQHMALAPAQDSLPEEILYFLCSLPSRRYRKTDRWREGIQNAFSAEQKAAFAADPQKLWNWILEHISSHDSREYGSLIAVPTALLKVGFGSHLSKKVLFTAVCRTLGIPSRINPETHSVQYWSEGTFHNVEQAEQGKVLPFTIQSGDDTSGFTSRIGASLCCVMASTPPSTSANANGKTISFPSSLPPVSIA